MIPERLTIVHHRPPGSRHFPTFLRTWLLAAWVVVASMVWASGVQAQRLHVRHYDIHDGLPSPRVRSITQGTDGRLWIAGPAGVAAYDGAAWEEFGLSAGLQWGDQTALRWDGSGHLISVSHRPPYPASRWRDEAWVPLRPPPNEAREVVLFDVAIEPSDGGLVYATDRGLFLSVGDEAWRLLGPDDGLPSASVRSLVPWRGGLALATDRGVAWLEDGAVDVVASAETLPSPEVLALASEVSDPARLWLVGQGWIGRLTERGFEVLAQHLAFRLSGEVPVRALADGLGGLYVSGIEATADWVDLRAYETGLAYFHPALGLQPLGAAEGIETGIVATLFLDREDNLWLGGEHGLTKIVSRRFGLWDRGMGLFDDAVVSAYERADGSVVLGHRGGLSLLRQQDGRTWIDTRSLPLSSTDQRRIEPVRDLVEDESGVLWLAAESAGVLALPTMLSSPRRYGVSSGLKGAATALAAQGGRLWVGTDRGVFVSDASGSGNGAERRFRSVPAGRTESIHVRQMEADGDALMVAAADGVFRLVAPSEPAASESAAALGSAASETKAQTRHWRCVGGGACNSTFGLLRRSADEWWVGTAAGLYRARHDSEPLERVDLGVLADIEQPIFFLVEQGDEVWLGTGDGVLRLSASFKSPVQRWKKYSVEDGLSGRETHRAAAFLDRDGRIWMGTDGGISVYDSRFDRATRSAPVVQLTALEAGGETYDPRKPLRLAAGDNDLVFHFRAVSLIDEDRVMMRRKLVGEEEWSEPFRNDGELHYSNLRPGTYQLHLQAAGAAETWSRSAMSGRVVVRAPFWSTPWFLGGLTLAAGLLTWGLVTLVSQRRYFHRLRREVAERTSELKASEDRYRKTFKAIDDGVVATDGEGRVQLLNPTAQRLTGWSEEEARGRMVEEVMSVFLSREPSDASVASRGADGVPDGDRTQGERMSLLGNEFNDTVGPTHTAVLESREGTRRHIELSTSPITSRDQGVTGLVFAFRDVTRRRRFEEELSRSQKLEAVGILAGGIAHDFNNLLTVLMGNLSLIHDAVRLDAASAKALADAESALVRARDLTQQLLTFSRGGAPVRETASVSEVLRQSASFVLSGSKVRFDLDLAPRLWLVDIDAGQISQVMQNLLINADQAMPAGGTVRITARNVADVPRPLANAAAARASSGHFVRIDVSDEGIGIPTELQMRIFDPYFSTKEEGRGLGLASAYAIVKKHEGLLTVRSEPPGGTTFSIFLVGSPQGLREGSERDPSGPTPTGGLPGFAGRRVLIMDDDRVVRRTAGAMLERLGCEVVHADHGARALVLYEEALDNRCRFDAVLMDLTVPGGMGGQEAVARLRDLDAEAVAIVYSGYSTDPVLAQFAHYGFDGRLSKPFRIRELATVLEEVFRLRRKGT